MCKILILCVSLNDMGSENVAISGVYYWFCGMPSHFPLLFTIVVHYGTERLDGWYAYPSLQQG